MWCERSRRPAREICATLHRRYCGHFGQSIVPGPASWGKAIRNHIRFGGGIQTVCDPSRRSGAGPNLCERCWRRSCKDLQDQRAAFWSFRQRGRVIGQVCLGLWWSSFFDDFPTLTASSVADKCKAQVHLLFDLLGIDFARDGDKAGSFGESFKALGLLIDLSEFSAGIVRIGHTESRRQELLSQIEMHLEQNCLKPKDAERLRGRLQWYDTFLFGRIANYSMSVIGKRAISLLSERQPGPAASKGAAVSQRTRLGVATGAADKSRWKDLFHFY